MFNYCELYFINFIFAKYQFFSLAPGLLLRYTSLTSQDLREYQAFSVYCYDDLERSLPKSKGILNGLTKSII